VKDPASTEPIVTLMLSLSNAYSIVRGVPQSLQNVRVATSDSLKSSIAVVAVNLKALFGTEMKGIYAEPDKCWHALQWQRVMSDGALLDVYLTDPQRQPPLKTRSSNFVFGEMRDPSAAVNY
jgi:hypothetical protein